jgi:uncharacterized protein (TIGR04222 family)
MNPFDLPGPEFLGLYAVLFVAAVTVAVFLRWYLRLPSDEPPRDGIELTAHEVAYLAGGPVLAVNAAMARRQNDAGFLTSRKERTGVGNQVT